MKTMNNKNILAIDTSSEYLSLALRVDSKTSYIFEKVGNLQSEFIIPKIQELLNKSGAVIQDIDFIAYNQGPGSFTGVRIGLSVSIGIALGLEISLIPIPAFAIFANNLITLSKTKNNLTNFDRLKIIVGIDARLNQIYLAGINAVDKSYFINPQLSNPEDIVTILAKENITNSPDNLNNNIQNLVFIGTGFSQYSNLLPSWIDDCYLKTDYPNALNMLELADSGIFNPIPATEAEVMYLRNKVALNLVEQQLAKS